MTLAELSATISSGDHCSDIPRSFESTGCFAKCWDLYLGGGLDYRDLFLWECIAFEIVLWGNSSLEQTTLESIVRMSAPTPASCQCSAEFRC